MNARDELGSIIWSTSRGDENSVSATGANIIADAILAARYRQPRTIEDTHADEGPDSLPPLSVILSGGKPAIKQYDHTFMDYDGGTWDYWELETPITVIYVPEVTA